MFNRIRESEPQNSVFFDDIEKHWFPKTGGQSPRSLSNGRSAQAQKPLKAEGQPASSGATTTLVLVAMVVSGIGLLWLAFKNRDSLKKG
jgi:hypothetical protein